MGKGIFGSIRNRVLVSFVAIVFTFILVIMVATGFLSRSLVNDLVEQNASALVQSYARIIKLWQDERTRELEQLANSALLETLDWDRIEPFLQRQIERSDSSHLIYFVATPDGNYNTTKHRNAGNLANRDYFPRVLAGETVISDPIISISTGEKIIVIATPIWNAEKSLVIGLLGLSIDLIEIYNNVDKFHKVHPDSNVFIVDKQGYFLTHYTTSLIMEARLQDYFPYWDTLLKEQAGSFSQIYEGISYRTFFHKLSGTENWTIITQIPTSFFTDPIKQLIYYLMAISTVCFILVFYLGSWFTSTIAEPIVELNTIFRQGAAGDLTVRAEVSSSDELGETRASFNRMMDTIGTMTYYDPLTGLPNRQYFLDHLNVSLAETPTIILALVSVRGLSELKTLLGSEVTDAILVRLAELLRTVCDREIVVAKIADAEFGVIIPSTTTGVLSIIDHLDNIISQPLYFDKEDLTIRLFGGISISEGDELTAESFYQQAQTALYEAERSINEQLKLYNPNTHHAMVDRIRFQTEIRSALEKEQFTVFYQPIVDLKTGAIVGKESLIRWIHPVRGLLMPNDFLEIAEQGGFIEEIGEYMLNKVCAQHKTWQDQGFEVGWVSVNISANHFRSTHFPSLVKSILDTYGMPPHVLRIEITEDAMLSPTPEVLQNFQDLRNMGVYLVIDDFGTAYSTLEYLVRYPMETLKIDRAFISHVDLNLRTQGLVRSIIGMGQNLNMITVAEGVERPNQIQLLREMGCIQAQGYYFSHPRPAEEFPKLMEELATQLRRDGFFEIQES